MTKTKSVKLETLKLNPDNPRTITDAAMSRLVKSVSEFTKMLEIRPIVYDENRVVIGGNMRYLALQRLGYEEVPETWVRCADNLTDEEKRRFVILDNGETFGDWDFDALANMWDDLPLADLGVDLPTSWLEEGGGEDGGLSINPVSYKEEEADRSKITISFFQKDKEKIMEAIKELQAGTQGVQFYE